jgi:hypothetical protein
MIKKIRLAGKFKINNENGIIQLYESVSINAVLVLSFIVAILYNTHRISLPITISLILIILFSILFKRCSNLDVKNGIIKRKLMIAKIVLLTYSIRSVGKNYKVIYEYHKLGVNGGFIILYYLILKNPETHIETILIKLRSEKDAIELKKLIDESKDSLN